MSGKGNRIPPTDLKSTRNCYFESCARFQCGWIDEEMFRSVITIKQFKELCMLHVTERRDFRKQSSHILRINELDSGDET